MPRYRASLETPLPPTAVFRFVTDFAHAARWDPRVLAATRTTPGPVGPGSRFVLVTRLAGREIELPYEIAEHAPFHRAVLAGRTLLFTYRDVLTVEPADASRPDAAARLGYDARLSLRGPLKLVELLLWPLFAHAFRKVGDDAVAGIRRALAAEHRRLQQPTSETPDTPEQDLFPDPTTLEGVDAIVALADRPVLRNLLITDAYSRFAHRFDRLLGPEDLHWSAYATWASRGAGAFIREEELDREVRALLERKGRLRRRLRRLRGLDAGGDGPLLALTREVSRWITAGNLIVFEELGALFARLLDLFDRPEPAPPEELDALLASLAPGPARPDRVRRDDDGTIHSERSGGQDLLRDALVATRDALAEDDPRRRSQLVLEANALVGLHEQIRLQTYILRGLDAPTARLAERHHPHLRPLADEIADEIGDDVRRAFTQLLMTLRSPGDLLALGKDLPAPPAPVGSPLYPPRLDPLDRPELIELLERHGAHGSSLGTPYLTWRALLRLRARWASLHLGRPVAAGSAARDWSELRHRMRYIFHYFRSRQASRSLLDEPFTPEQRRALRQGRLPHGPL